MADLIIPPSLNHDFPTTNPSRSYDPAFAEDDANIILASSDGTYYRVPSYTLRTTSGFFRGMMTLPKTDHQNDDVIVLDELSKVLGTLLRMIGGLEFPKLQSFGELEDVLAAADKYDMPGPRVFIRSIITTPPFLEEPLRLYAIAARYDWEEAAKFASKHTLALSIYDNEHAAIIDRMPAAYLMRLLRLHRERVAMFKEHITRGDGCFGVPLCPSCRQKTKGTIIGHLASLMVSEMDKQPSGHQLLARKWMQWPAYKEGRSCSTVYCGATYAAHWPRIAEEIESSLQLLPSSI